MTACNCCNDEGCVCVGTPACKGCHRYWRRVEKSGYCEECENAIREDIEDGKLGDALNGEGE